jgi:hypothetical protein
MSGAYRDGAHTFYGIISQTSSDNYKFDETQNPNLFPELVNNIESVMNFYSSNQNTFSVGWRWDINTNVTSKIQINRTNVDQQGSTLWLNPSIDTSAETITSMLYTLSFAL